MMCNADPKQAARDLDEARSGAFRSLDVREDRATYYRSARPRHVPTKPSGHHYEAPSRTEVAASAVEYSLIVAAIAGIITAIVFSLGALTGESYQRTCDNLMDAYPAGTAPSC